MALINQKCLHCGRPFHKQDTNMVWRRQWRFHAICLDFADNGNHPLKSCIACFQKWSKNDNP